MKSAWITKYYPQNYIIKRPVFGSSILFAFSLCFTLIYQPLNTEESYLFNFEATMAIYASAASFFAWLTIVLIKQIPFFQQEKKWSVLKELISVYLVLQVMGITLFFMAFIIEEPTETGRWNISTFIDSCKFAFLVWVFPFAFFTAMSYRNRLRGWKPANKFQDNDNSQPEAYINISSTLKKESLKFLPNELLFASSDGNYVVFYLYQDDKIKKVSIRNSISNIENQLNDFPSFFRCHRAFIVNVEKVISRKGNSWGYQLTLRFCDKKIPVSRQNVKAFDSLFRENDR